MNPMTTSAEEQMTDDVAMRLRAVVKSRMCEYLCGSCDEGGIQERKEAEVDAALDRLLAYTAAQARAELAAEIHGWGCPMPCRCGDLRQIFEGDYEAALAALEDEA